MTLVVALAAVGVGYGLWSKTLFIQGSVSAGDLNAVFLSAFTDDDGAVINAEKEGQDTGPDPMAPGPNPARIADNLASCTAAVATAEQDLDAEVGIRDRHPQHRSGLPATGAPAGSSSPTRAPCQVSLEAVQIRC
jgi:hypothetical protein